MHISSRFKMATLTSTIVLGLSLEMPITIGNADTITQQVDTTGYQISKSHSLEGLERYIVNKNGTFMLEIPENEDISLETQSQLNERIDIVNQTIEKVTDSSKFTDEATRRQIRSTWKYWGNGVYTNGNKVRVDWAQAWNAVGRISGNAWVEGLGRQLESQEVLSDVICDSNYEKERTNEYYDS